MPRKARVTIPGLPDGSHRQAGRFDKAGRWYPADDYVVAGSFQVRSPSRAWPYSYLKHFYTSVYSRALLFAEPALWLALQGMAPESAEAAPFVALVAERRMVGGEVAA